MLKKHSGHKPMPLFPIVRGDTNCVGVWVYLLSKLLTQVSGKLLKVYSFPAPHPILFQSPSNSKSGFLGKHKESEEAGKPCFPSGVLTTLLWNQPTATT